MEEWKGGGEGREGTERTGWQGEQAGLDGFKDLK